MFETREGAEIACSCNFPFFSFLQMNPLVVTRSAVGFAQCLQSFFYAEAMVLNSRASDETPAHVVVCLCLSRMTGQ